MQFLYPGLLWALAAISIPILVHLFNFRRFKKVQFSNVDFLKEIKQETKSKSKLKHLLILLTRILAIAAIVFAFAQPFIPLGENEVKTGKKTVGIYIDNSFSMESEGEFGSIIEIAKNKALEVVKYHDPTDVFQIITNDFEGRHQRWFSQEEASEMISEISLSPQTKTLSEVYSRHEDLSLQEEADSRNLYLVSDLQKSVTDISNLSLDSSFQLMFLPTSSSYAENIYIDSVWFSTPSRALNRADQLNVRVKNTLSSPRENVSLRLYIDGTQKSVLSFNLEPNVASDTTLTFSNSTAGYKKGRVQLDDYPITFDDDFYFGFEVSDNTSVLEISGNSGKVFSKIFENQSEYTFERFSSNQVNYNRFSEFDLIILNQLSFISSGLKQELEKFSNVGGSIVVVPNKEAEISSYNSLFSALNADLITEKRSAETKVNRLNLDHFVYSSVFDKSSRNMPLPSVNAYFQSTKNSRQNRDVLATLQNGSPALSHFQKGNSSLYAFYMSLNNSENDLSSNAMLVYTFHSIANHAKASTKPYVELGNESFFKIKAAQSNSAETILKMNSDEGLEFIPEFRRTDGAFEIYPESQVSKSGIYTVTSGDEQVGNIGINYNRAESQIEYFTPSEIEEQLSENGIKKGKVLTDKLETLQASILETNEGKVLWRMFIILALILLGIEIILIKYWK